MPPRLLTPARFAYLRAFIFILCLLPAAFAIKAVFFSASPPSEPVGFLTLHSGETALRLLVITLSMTPLAIISKSAAPIKLRRMFGLYVFFYALCHFSVYLLLDLQLDFSILWDDVIERKYITVGFLALVLLCPLAITSNKFSLKKMGFRNWQRLHRAVYIISIAGAIHFLWIKRAKNIGEPIIYLIIICLLLALRLPFARQQLERLRR